MFFFIKKISLAFVLKIYQCAVPENISTRDWNFLRVGVGGGGSVRPNDLKKCMKLTCNWTFHKISVQGIEFPGGPGGGGSARPNNLKKCMKLTCNWTFQGAGVEG